MAISVTPAPLGEPIVVGRFRGGAAYEVWRPRGTADWLLMYTVSGSGRVARPRGDDYAAEPGSLVVVAPGTPHSYGTEPGAGHWELLWVHVIAKPDWLPLLDWPGDRGGVRARILSTAAQPSVENSLMESLAYYRFGGPLGYAFATNSLERALLHVQQQPGAIPETDARIVAVLDHIRSDLGSPMSPKVLAPLASLSPSRLAHRFREVVGVSLHMYVEQQRMTAARQLLAYSDQPVSSVARQVGYADPLYFSTRFRRIFDETPSGYRARMKGDAVETRDEREH